MNERKIGTCLFLSILFLAAACTSNEDLAKERARRAQAAQGNIRIAVVWQRKLAQTYFFQGTELAINEINRGGGINGRKLDSQRYFNDTAEVENDRHIAKSIAADEDMVAVVGHYTSEGAIAASVTYEFSGLLYISPAATNVGVSRHGFQFVFRNTLSDEVNGAQLAEFSKRRGYLRMAVIDDRMVYGKGLADIFHERASKIGIDVVARRSYDSMGKDFKPLFADIKHLQFDAIFLGGSMPTAAEVIKQARIMGVMEPFFGGR